MCSNVGVRGANGGKKGISGSRMWRDGRWRKYTGPSAERNDEDPAQGQVDEESVTMVTDGAEGHRQCCPPSPLYRRPVYSPQSMITPPGPAGATPIGRSASRRSHLRARLSSRRRPSSAKRQARLCSRIHSFSSLLSMCSSTIRVWMGTHVSRSKPSQLWSGSVFLVRTSRTTRTDSIRMPNSLLLSVLGRVRNQSGWMGYGVGATYNSRARW
jgi:hypothetical protein